MTIDMLHAAYPVAILQDRYGGGYSGGTWIAIRNADTPERGTDRLSWVAEDGPSGNDVDAADFWQQPPPWIAVGETPDAALTHLLKGDGRPLPAKGAVGSRHS